MSTGLESWWGIERDRAYGERGTGKSGGKWKLIWLCYYSSVTIEENGGECNNKYETNI